VPDRENPHGYPTITETLLPVHGAARRARDVVTAACIDWEVAEVVGPTCQIVTELVTNAAVHASTLIDLTLLYRRDDLMIQVRDGSLASPVRPGTEPMHVKADAGAYGLGLRIVSALAFAWGFSLDEDGKVVWATLTTSRLP
jgi:two-component sensor histidine kinase